MKITDILQPSAILLNTTFATKDAALDAMIDALASGGHITKVEEARKAVFDREKIMSTGIGKGFALPHGKTNHITETVGAFMTLKDPLDFQALDQQPVNIIGRENTVGTHLRLLSRISRLMNKDSFRDSISAAEKPEQVISLFASEEEELG
jgi:mannitol/fructose-specific phosphotransferase system IIA component (Ntr-type)